MARRRGNSRRVVSTTTRHPGGAPRTHRSCPLGERIESIAAARSLTLPEVAERAGISPVSMNDIRRGRFRPRLDTLDRIAAALSVDAAYLLASN